MLPCLCGQWSCRCTLFTFPYLSGCLVRQLNFPRTQSALAQFWRGHKQFKAHALVHVSIVNGHNWQCFSEVLLSSSHLDFKEHPISSRLFILNAISDTNSCGTCTMSLPYDSRQAERVHRLTQQQCNEGRARTFFSPTFPFPLRYLLQLTDSMLSLAGAMEVMLQGLPQLQMRAQLVLVWFRTYSLNFFCYANSFL